MRLQDQGIITGLKPVGGWRYPQPFGGGVIMVFPEHAPKGHYPDKGEKLLEAVVLFRRQMHLAPGEPDKDVADFIRRASPQNDYHRGKLPDSIGKPRIRAITPLIEEIKEWIEKAILDKPELIGQGEAIDRAVICMRCQQNIRWQIDCEPCCREVETRGIMLRAEASFEYDPALLACRLHKLFLQSAVFIDRDFLPARSEHAPANCWIP